MRNLLWKRNLLPLALIAAIIAVFCNCITTLPSHACCESHQSYSADKNKAPVACCQIKTAVITPSLNLSDIPDNDDWISSSRIPPNYFKLAIVNPEFQAIESQVFIKDQSKRRRLELSVFLN